MRENMMQTPDSQRNPNRLDDAETKEIIEIMTKFFEKQTGSKKRAVQYVNSIANLIKNPAAKLIHLGNAVFLVLVKDKGVIEFHTMAVNETASGLAEKLKELTKILKNMGATKIYTYANEEKYKAVAKRSKLPWVISEHKAEDGKTYDVYTLETV